MEDDDEFGDLYTDVLRPLQPQPEQSAPAPAAGKAAPPQRRPIDLNIDSDDEEILYGASDSMNSKLSNNLNPDSDPREKSNALIRDETLPEARGIDLNLDSNQEAAGIDGLGGKGGDGSGFEARVLEEGHGSELRGKAPGESSFMEDEDDINIIVEEREDKDDDLVENDANLTSKDENMYSAAVQEERTLNFVNEAAPQQMIPGLSQGLENSRAPNNEEEWESDESDDDLQIVLNDNNHGPMGMEMMPGMMDEDDEDGEPLVIVADNGDVPHHPSQRAMDDPEWTGEEGGPGADGEKDLGEATKASGGGGGAAPPTAQPKIAYSNHAYHHPFSSQFKVSILFDQQIECNLDSSCNCSAFVVNWYVLVMLKMNSNIVNELTSHSYEILKNNAFKFSIINEITNFCHAYFPCLRLSLVIKCFKWQVVETN